MTVTLSLLSFSVVMSILLGLLACVMAAVALGHVMLLSERVEMRCVKVAILESLYRESQPVLIRTLNSRSDQAIDELLVGEMASLTDGDAMIAITPKGRRYLELGAP